jgi:phage baseplate assembly protein W
MLVSYPFYIRKDTLMTKTLERGTIEAIASELSLFLSTEEGDVHHIPDYGVKKRDLLFTDLDDSALGVLQFRFQEKVDQWFEGVTLLDVKEKSRDRNNKATLSVLFEYNGDTGEVEVT